MQTNIKETAKSLASLPEAQRKAVLKEQLSQFARCNAEECTEAVGALLESVCALPEKDCKQVAKTHLQCLCELPEQSRQQLIPLHVEVLKAAPLQHRQMEIAVAKELIPALSAQQRAIIQQFIAQIAS